MMDLEHVSFSGAIMVIGSIWAIPGIIAIGVFWIKETTNARRVEHAYQCEWCHDKEISSEDPK
jgi:hypothetical protein